ncbi:MAG: amino acid permease [Bacteroidota bacterium]|nr:amino acid permease [Bacteroidota bacterium]
MPEIMQQEKNIIDEFNIPLKRVVGWAAAILMVAGNMIGTGVFKKVVPMAQTGLNENFILLAWIVAGLIVIFGAFTFAGLAKLTTAPGGTYEYLRLCFGNFPAFLNGWGLFIIIGSGSIAAIAFIFSQSVNSLIALPNPFQQWSHISIAGYIYPFESSGIKIFSVVTIVMLTWFNVRGVKNSTILNTIVTTAKILGILFLIVVALVLSSPSPIADNTVYQNSSLVNTSFLSIFLGAMLSSFWAYDGFTNVTALAGEIKDPKKNLPIAIITGVLIVMTLYVLANYAFMKAMPLQQLAALGENKIAATEIAGKLLGPRGTVLISVLIILSSFGALNIIILFYSRVYLRMSQEGVFFKGASKVHPVYRTPYNALWYSMIWSCLLVLSGTYDVLTNMVIFTGFAFYLLAAVGLIKMKRKKVIKEKIPAYPLAPVLFIICTGVFLIGILINYPRQSLTGTALLLTGVPFYYYFRKNNKVINNDL